MPEFATLVFRHRLEELLNLPTRTVLETEILPAYVAKRRWFASKGEKLNAVRIAYAVRLPSSADPVLLSEIEVQVGDRLERYALPLGGARRMRLGRSCRNSRSPDSAAGGTSVI